MKIKLFTALVTFILFLMPYIDFGQAPNLGTTSSFAMFKAAGAFNNIGASNIEVNVHPNPFHTKAIFEFQNTGTNSNVSIDVFNLKGNQIIHLFDKVINKGVIYTAELNSENLNGKLVLIR